MKETVDSLYGSNQNTQPVRFNKNFNNWNFVPQGWVVVAKSNELKKKKILSKSIYDHRIVIFRTESGKVSAVDSFCPHMGMDLEKGSVQGEEIRCHFHHWKFNGNGACTDIPCLDRLPDSKKINVQSYPVEEKYGLIWVYTDKEAKYPVYEIDHLKGKEVLYTHLKPFVRLAHPHITMMNSIDEQHMRTVHLIEFDLDVKTKEEGTRFRVDFEGTVETKNWMGKIQNFILGNKWRSEVHLIDGCLGILNIMMNTKLFNKIPIPAGHYLFSQSFTKEGETYVWPIIVTEKRKGILGFLFSKAYLLMLKATMWALAYQDGRVIYGHLRFSPSGLIPGIDDTTARWIRFVNKTLKPSMWSKVKVDASEKDDKNEDKHQIYKEPSIERASSNHSPSL